MERITFFVNCLVNYNNKPFTGYRVWIEKLNVWHYYSDQTDNNKHWAMFTAKEIVSFEAI